MRISLDNLKEIVKKYRVFLINKRIVDMVLVNSRLFLFYLKNEKKKLIIDLDNNNPHIGVLDVDYNELSLPSDFVARTLIKGKPLISDITLVNNDKIIKITTSSTDAFYHHNFYYLYIELISAHANMILTNEHNKIIAAFYETNLSSPRLIIKNNLYRFPEKKSDDYQNHDFSFKEYETELKKAYDLSLIRRKKELYGNDLKKYERKVRSLEKKIEKINESQEKAKDLLNAKEIGNLILMNASEIKKGDKFFQEIKLDPDKSPIENATMYFNKYKKAKRTIEMTFSILKDVKEELENNLYALDVLKYGNEEEIKQMIKPSPDKKKISIPKYFPYYIKYKNTTYYYGHNALENDYLTFKMFKKSSNVTWLHIKDTPSSHLIINKENPSNEELDIACSILLIKNKLTTGEIIYTKRENITRANALAKVNLLSYKSITMHKINKIAYEIIKKEKRVHE